MTLLEAKKLLNKYGYKLINEQSPDIKAMANFEFLYSKTLDKYSEDSYEIDKDPLIYEFDLVEIFEKDFIDYRYDMQYEGNFDELTIEAQYDSYLEHMSDIDFINKLYHYVKEQEHKNNPHIDDIITTISDVYNKL